MAVTRPFLVEIGQFNKTMLKIALSLEGIDRSLASVIRSSADPSDGREPRVQTEDAHGH